MSEKRDDVAAKRWATQDVDQPWSIGEAIGVSMRSIGGHLVSLILPLFVVQLIGLAACAAPSAWGGMTYGLARLFKAPPAIRTYGDPVFAPIPQSVPVSIVAATVVTALLVAGLMNSLLAESTLAAVRDEPVPAGRIGRALRRWPKLLGWQLLHLIVVAVPAALIEGIALLGTMIRDHSTEATAPWWVHLAAILVLVSANAVYIFGFCWTPFVLADDGRLGLIAAMRKSWKVSRQYVGTIFLYLVALAPIALLTLVPILGLFAYAFVWLGLGYGYVRATGRNDLPWYSPEFASKSIRTFLRILLASLGAIAGTLVFFVKAAPSARGTQWSIQDTAMRAAAIVSSVAVIVVVMALLLPYMLDRLEGRRFTSFVAARHVRSQKSGFLTIISVLSICGVALSSCALSSVVSVMGGFSQDLKRKILGNNAHIVVDTTSAVPWEDYNATLERIEPRGRRRQRHRSEEHQRRHRAQSQHRSRQARIPRAPGKARSPPAQ